MPPLSERARRTARAAVDFADRVLHPLRRARVQARLGGVAAEAGVLFVCHGNICRSPYAEAAFRALVAHRASGAVEIRSAGFVGPGQPSPPEAVEAARLRGIDLSSHRSILLSRELVRESGLIVVMDASQRRALSRLFGRIRGQVVVLGDLDPMPIRRRAIRDPYGEEEAVFGEVFGRLDRCLRSLHLQVQGRIRARRGRSGGSARAGRTPAGHEPAPRAIPG